MSRTLYLLRHAKSSWDDAGLADHDRPLAPRGRRAADAIARHMQDETIAPELVLSSTARRARETAERIQPALGTAPVEYERALYGARAVDLLERVRAVPDEIASVLVVGHNPAMEQLALGLARPAPLRFDLETKFPTGALATLSVDAETWSGLGPGDADLVAFVRPRDLEG
jgi:phosphohistidine phosphatase